MEIFFIRALQLIMALSLLVLVHEFGHFIFSRIFKVRVEKFYLFFDYKFSLFKWKPKNSDTEYGIGWLPLGGYCKISGMIDESMDTEQMKLPPTAIRISRKARLPASADNDRWSTFQLYSCTVHLLNDSIHMGRELL